MEIYESIELCFLEEPVRKCFQVTFRLRFSLERLEPVLKSERSQFIQLELAALHPELVAKAKIRSSRGERDLVIASVPITRPLNLNQILFRNIGVQQIAESRIDYDPIAARVIQTQTNGAK